MSSFDSSVNNAHLQESLQTNSLSFLLNLNWPSITDLRDAVSKLLSEYLNQSSNFGLDLLKEEAFTDIKLLIASNPNVPSHVLSYLAIHGSPKILERIAENPNTTSDTLSALSQHEDACVRLAVAENANTRAKDLETLSNDTNADIRYVLAECPHVPVSILKKLSEDENIYVNNRAQKTLERLSFETTMANYLEKKAQEEKPVESTILDDNVAKFSVYKSVTEQNRNEQNSSNSDNGIDNTDETIKELRNKLIDLANINAELQATRDNAITVAHMKSAFITSVSHELRTPLSAILGMNELLLCTVLTTEQRDLAKGIQEAAQSLHNMVDSILDIDKIESGKMDIENIPFNVIFLVQDATRLLVDAAKTKNLKLTTHIDQHIPELVYGDSGHIREVLVNLIGNTIRFTKRGEICIEAVVESEDIDNITITFIVRNTGDGISEEEKKLIFMPFTQVERNKNNSATDVSMGLGLNISKQLVSMMGGTIELGNDKDPDTIVRFTLTFKRIRPESMLAASEKISEPSTTRPDKLVLVVEDNDVLQRLAIKQLANIGVHAQAVAAGQDALAAVKEISFDLILMDCHMPEMNGFDATKAIRQLESETGKHTPIIAMTAHAMKGDAERCMAAGMDDYLSKPVNIEQLKQKIERWLVLDKKTTSSHAKILK
jgi:signal transduction histidine kinase/ActR/RegA family two-component response regulator